MLGGGARDARRTERYLNGLLTADDRRAPEIPMEIELDPAVRLAARELRADLVRVHPSFRFEEGLATRLARAAVRAQAGLPVEPPEISAPPAAVAPFRRDATARPHDRVRAASRPAPAASSNSAGPAAGLRRLPGLAARPPRPLLVGGVGVASAAISIGAVYVAWRRSHHSPAPMARAARAAHGRSRRMGVLQGILGVMS